MKIVLLAVLSLMTVLCSAQTKKETEDWLKFQIGEHFSSSWSFDYLTNTAYDYYFSGQYMLVTKGVFTRKTHSDTDQLISLQRDIIDLKKIKKVEAEVKVSPIDTTKFYVIFNFYTDESGKACGVFEDLYMTDSVLSKQVSFAIKAGIEPSCNYAIRFENQDTQINDLPNRVAKAFNHLIVLNGGNLIKDSF